MKPYIIMLVLLAGFAVTMNWQKKASKASLDTAVEAVHAEYAQAEKDIAEQHAQQMDALQAQLAEAGTKTREALANAARLSAVIVAYDAKATEEQRVVDAQAEEESNAASEARAHELAVEIDGKRTQLAKIVSQARILNDTIQRAEAQLIEAKQNTDIYGTRTTRRRCTECRGTGKITERKATAIVNRRCGNCGVDGTVETSTRVRTGTRSTEGLENAIKNLEAARDKLKQMYDEKQAEIDALVEDES